MDSTGHVVDMQFNPDDFLGDFELVELKPHGNYVWIVFRFIYRTGSNFGGTFRLGKPKRFVIRISVNM